LTERVHLADINVLVALHEGGHPHHRAAKRWFDSRLANGHGSAWATCLLTQAGFIRLMTNPRVGSHSLEEATKALALLTSRSRHTFWPIADDWSALSAPFAERLFGHQQVTDACLLGLAVRQYGVLVTMDKTISHLAGSKYRANLLLLSPG
jgi:toxin-antitoxin system PIN domain toxin